MNKWMIRFLISFMVGVILIGSGSLQAQSKKKSKKKRKASVNFEDELVHGEVKGSELLYLLRRKQFNYKKLIKLRNSFLPEMRRSAEEVRRGKGK